MTPDILTPYPLTDLPLILGLQNDIIGFPKDHILGNPLSAIQVLIRDGSSKEKAFGKMVRLHNKLIKNAIVNVEARKRKGFFGPGEEIYMEVVLSWGNAMCEWMLGCERYKVSVPGASRLR